jgi:hypothetical protein
LQPRGPADFGKDRLLRSYAKRMSLKMDEAKDGSLEPPYDYLQSVLERLPRRIDRFVTREEGPARIG